MVVANLVVPHQTLANRKACTIGMKVMGSAYMFYSSLRLEYLVTVGTALWSVQQPVHTMEESLGEQGRLPTDDEPPRLPLPQLAPDPPMEHIYQGKSLLTQWTLTSDHVTLQGPCVRLGDKCQ
jgi:hypothetical protein